MAFSLDLLFIDRGTVFGTSDASNNVPTKHSRIVVELIHILYDEKWIGNWWWSSLSKHWTGKLERKKLKMYWEGGHYALNLICCTTSKEIKKVWRHEYFEGLTVQKV